LADHILLQHETAARTPRGAYSCMTPCIGNADGLNRYNHDALC